MQLNGLNGLNTHIAINSFTHIHAHTHAYIHTHRLTAFSHSKIQIHSHGGRPLMPYAHELS